MTLAGLLEMLLAIGYGNGCLMCVPSLMYGDVMLHLFTFMVDLNMNFISGILGSIVNDSTKSTTFKKVNFVAKAILVWPM